MAKVWFVRRRGERWIAPGGQPAFEMPLDGLIFKLDLGPQRRVHGIIPEPATSEPPAPPESLDRVIVEVTEGDVESLLFSTYLPGYYDSPYRPREVARRLAAARSER